MLTLACISTFIILKILKSKEALELKVGNWELTGLLILVTWTVFGLIGFIIQFLIRRKEKRNKKSQKKEKRSGY